MAKVARGEIWQCSFAKPDHRRPVLVLTRADMIARLNHVTIAPITKTIREVPSEVVIGVESGLKRPSAVNLHHVMTVPLALLRTFVGTASSDTMEQVRIALLFALGFRSRP